LVGLLGPSLLHLAAQLKVGVSDVAWIFTTRAAGSALGSTAAVGGTVAIWGETTARRSMMQWGTLLCMGAAGCNAVIPICTELKTLLSLMFIQGLFAGYLDSISIMELHVPVSTQRIQSTNRTQARHPNPNPNPNPTTHEQDSSQASLLDG